MAHRCSGCNALFSMMSGAPAADVYVGKSTGTPVSIDTIAAHYAASNVQAGSTPQCPFENFEDAMNCAAVAAKVHGQATVHILDDAYVPDNYTTPAHSGTIIITGGTLHFDEPRRYFKLYGNTTFEHLTFCSAYTEDSSSLIISARNYKLVMGEGIVMGNADTIPTEEGFPDCNSVKMYVFGGYIGPSNYTMNTDITIRSGDYWCIGGWNMNASTNDGASKITIGKTNPDDKLQVFYLTPFSRGDGYITQPAEGTIIVDGDLYVKRFYVTTINKATSNIEYVTNVVLKGNITGVNMEEVDLPFDIRGTNTPYPKTTVNVFTDERVISAVENAYVFLDNPWGTGHAGHHAVPPERHGKRIQLHPILRGKAFRACRFGRGQPVRRMRICDDRIKRWFGRALRARPNTSNNQYPKSTRNVPQKCWTFPEKIKNLLSINVYAFPDYSF